jgi:hypothetical protein
MVGFWVWPWCGLAAAARVKKARPDGQGPGGRVWWAQTARPDMRERQRQGCVSAWVTGVPMPESHQGEGAHHDGEGVDTGVGA